MKNILVYGGVDLNLIDGSSIWVISLCNVLTKDKSVKVTLLLKTPAKRMILLDSIKKNPQIQIIDPWDFSYSSREMLTAFDALKIIQKLDEGVNYDIFITRGLEISLKIAETMDTSQRLWAYIVDFPKDEEKITTELISKLNCIYENSAHILCQTSDMADYYKKFIKNYITNKFYVLKPMIKDYTTESPHFQVRYNNIIYAGKFSRLWCISEMIEGYEKARQKGIDAEFHIAGDKFHNEFHEPDFKNSILEMFKLSKGLVWHGGISPDMVEVLTITSDIGISLRKAAIDKSMEISTKLLEYGRLGKPVVVNRNETYVNFLGDDYPFFANNPEEISEALVKCFNSPDKYKIASERLYESCRKYSYSVVYNELKPLLYEK